MNLYIRALEILAFDDKLQNVVKVFIANCMYP